MIHGFCRNGRKQLRQHCVRALLGIAMTICAIGLWGCSDEKPSNTNQAAAPAATPDGKRHVAVLETSAGTIKFQLLDDQAPKTAQNRADICALASARDQSAIAAHAAAADPGSVTALSADQRRLVGDGRSACPVAILPIRAIVSTS